MKKRLLVTLFALAGVCVSRAQTYQPTWESVDSRPVPEWFTDAKFGIFVHWGLYSVPAWATVAREKHGGENFSEWYWYWLNGTKSPAYIAHHNATYGGEFRYQDFVKDFTCEMFDPAQWAGIFKAAGAKYVVLTSKHHEGYALWPSTHSWNWNSVDTGPHRDLAGDLTAAVKGAGMHMGFYYSLYEWFNPLYKSDLARYVDEHMLPQMKDLVTRYEPDVVWPDGEWEHPSEAWRSAEFLAWLYNESPVRETVVVNDRWGKETRGAHGGFWTTEYDHMHSDDLGGQTIAHPWEECRGIGGSFGWNRNEILDDYSSSERLVHLLIEKVSGGGNLLLNVGPTADGRIPVIMQQRLRDMGDWLAVNGEAIYGTRLWNRAPKERPENVYFTAKGDDLYVILTRWPERPVRIEGVSRSRGVTMLGFDGKVKGSVSGGTLTIHPPTVSPADNPCNHAWVFKIEGGAK